VMSRRRSMPALATLFAPGARRAGVTTPAGNEPGRPVTAS
jgi:hypothetical protein